MFVFNDGVPRSGKSYDAVKNHILPALRKRRHVWARLNGLEEADGQRRQAIADHLKMPVSEVNHFLHHVATKDVVATFQCVKDADTGEWRIPENLKNALIVIDEVHEFYVKERKPLLPAVEQFFALLGQNGSDGVIMTQYVDRLHIAIYSRVEKKNGFQKLTAVGMKGKYQQKYYQTVAPTKFKLISSETKDYEPAIFPLYKGYADGVDTESMEPYAEGSTNVWKGMMAKGIIFGVIGIVAVVVLLKFFTGGAASLVGDAPQVIPDGQPYQPADDSGIVESAMTRPGGAVKEAIDPFKDLTQTQRYVAELSERGRIRVAARAEIGGRTLAQIQWVTPEGITQESLWLTDLEELGFTVTAKSYGFLLEAGKFTLVATPWPLLIPVRESEAKLYNTSGAGERGGDLASVASESDADASRAGSAIVERAQNTSITFPESPALPSAQN